MVWNHFARTSIRLLFWIGFAVVALVFGGREDKCKAKTLTDGQVEFRPNKFRFWGSLILAVCFAYLAATHLSHGYKGSLDPFISASLGLIPLITLFSLPGTIIITEDGMTQLFWLRKKKHIRWEDIVEINTGEKSRDVTITSAKGVKIVHSLQLIDRPRLLTEIKHYCGENLPPDFPRERISNS